MLRRFEVLVGRAKRGLAAASMVREALRWLALTGAALGLLTLIASIARLPGAGLPGFLGLCALSAGAGALAAYARRPGFRKAAAFLDGQLGDKELMSAALLCSNRGLGGRFDAAIVAMAEVRAESELSGTRRRLDYGYARMRRIALLASLSFAVGLGLAAIPAEFGSRLSWGFGRPGAADGRVAVGNDADTAGPGIETAKSIARSVFPDDQRLSRAAERAISTARYDEFRSLVQRADADLAKRITKSESVLERERLERERESLRKAAEDAMKKMEESASENGGGGGPGSAAMGGSGPGQGALGAGQDGQGGGVAMGEEGEEAEALPASPQDPAARNEEREAAGGNGPGSEGSEKGEKGSGGGGDSGGEPAGHDAGRGEGQTRDFSGLFSSPRSDAPGLELEAKDSPPFEIVMPGREALPGGSTAAEGLKSAEAAFTRDRVPLEYEDSVRSYFLSIANMNQGEDE